MGISRVILTWRITFPTSLQASGLLGKSFLETSATSTLDRSSERCSKPKKLKKDKKSKKNKKLKNAFSEYLKEEHHRKFNNVEKQCSEVLEAEESKLFCYRDSEHGDDKPNKHHWEKQSIPKYLDTSFRYLERVGKHSQWIK
ncbi:unnamed protein product [Moneuplotes crassus]|uniref:Uncharacterized protein n=1 Tax=Euplotes crassus TaxID=5936 RepID=A0AAD1Y0C9_EUPCR|nr:unnamed protein product [Moneuplotes crassus]